jgi:hypothetical protein
MNYQKLQQTSEENPLIPNRRELWEAIQKGDLIKYSLRQLEEGMLEVDINGDTLYHTAAERGYLDRLPEDLLTEENLLKANSVGWNSLHKAARYNHLEQIPITILSAKNLLEKGGRKPFLHFNCIDLIERDLKRLPKNLPPETLKAIRKYLGGSGNLDDGAMMGMSINFSDDLIKDPPQKKPEPPEKTLKPTPEPIPQKKRRKLPEPEGPCM